VLQYEVKAAQAIDKCGAVTSFFPRSDVTSNQAIPKVVLQRRKGLEFEGILDHPAHELLNSARVASG
jgi:hypothetical protein